MVKAKKCGSQEERALGYLFKLKQTQNVKRFIAEKMVIDEWTNAGQGWQGCIGELKLMGWKKARRVIILRRKIKKEVGVLLTSAFPPPNKAQKI